jgi:hypothetical protein
MVVAPRFATIYKSGLSRNALAGGSYRSFENGPTVKAGPV